MCATMPAPSVPYQAQGAVAPPPRPRRPAPDPSARTSARSHTGSRAQLEQSVRDGRASSGQVIDSRRSDAAAVHAARRCDGHGRFVRGHARFSFALRGSKAGYRHAIYSGRRKWEEPVAATHIDGAWRIWTVPTRLSTGRDRVARLGTREERGQGRGKGGVGPRGRRSPRVGPRHPAPFPGKEAHDLALIAPLDGSDQIDAADRRGADAAHGRRRSWTRRPAPRTTIPT